MRILCTGSDGMVGTSVIEVFKDYDLVSTDIGLLDVRDSDAVFAYEKRGIDLIIHLAAETDLEKCQTYPEHAYYTNHTGTMNMAILAERLDIPIVYISTAGVFDGNKDIYNEYDYPDPINHYGRSKLYGESVFGNKYYIFRAGWMMGGGPKKDKKFVNKVIKQIWNGKKVIYALQDVYGSPTYTHDLAESIKAVVELGIGNNYGLYNCAGEGKCSRYDVAKAIVEFLGLKEKVTVVPVIRGYFQKDFFCPRSQNEALDNSKLRAMNISKMRPWKTALHEYIVKEFIDAKKTY